jgi:hypothetical protein
MELEKQLEIARRRQEIADLDAGDQRTAAEFAKRISLPPIDLPAGVRAALDSFNIWAGKRHARRCPAKPATVALFALEQSDMGVAIDTILAQLNAIEAMHDKWSLPSPVKSVPVRYALETLLKPSAPRSWSKSEKAEWVLLPLPIRDAISRRERERDLALTRAQNEFAKLRQNTSGADKIAHNTETEKDQTHETICT